MLQRKLEPDRTSYKYALLFCVTSLVNISGSGSSKCYRSVSNRWVNAGRELKPIIINFVSTYMAICCIKSNDSKDNSLPSSSVQNALI